jgi:hypothetical protein
MTAGPFNPVARLRSGERLCHAHTDSIPWLANRRGSDDAGGATRGRLQFPGSDALMTTWASLKRFSGYQTNSSPTQGLPIDGKGHIQSSQDAEHDHAVRKRILSWLQTDFGFVIVLHSVQRGSIGAGFGRPNSVHWAFAGVVDFSGAWVVPELLTCCCLNLYAGV